MRWALSHCCDPRARPLADRHYNRQKPGAARFIAPGSPLVLQTVDGRAVWATLVQLPQFQKHAWPGAWVNTLFRREEGAEGRASELIAEAVAASRFMLGDPPARGIISFVNPGEVRHKRDPGRCYKKAGWARVEDSKGGLWTYQQLPGDMPAPEPPLNANLELFGAA